MGLKEKNNFNKILDIREALAGYDFAGGRREQRGADATIYALWQQGLAGPPAAATPVLEAQ